MTGYRKFYKHEMNEKAPKEDLHRSFYDNGLADDSNSDIRSIGKKESYLQLNILDNIESYEGDDDQSDDKNKSSDSDDYDTGLEDCKTDIIEKKKREQCERENVDIGHVSYKEACGILDTSPIRLVLQQLRGREIRLQHVGLNTKDTIALSYALLHNNRVESVDLEDNGMTEEAVVHIVEVLRHNINISSMSLSENKMTINCTLVVGEMMQDTNFLTHLNLSGTNLGDTAVKHIAQGLRGNVSLIWLNLSHNEIASHGSQALGKALEINDTLQVLNISWNHIRRMGAVAICRGLQENKALVNLDLSWNGFAFEGSIVLEEALKKNKTLKVLDISNNRINWEGIVYITRGLKSNSSLQMLKIGNNPISMEGCERLVRAVSGSNSAVVHVGLEDVPVNAKVVSISQNISFQRVFSVSHGGVLDTKDTIGIRRERRDDPLTLLVRYLGVMGIRVVDLFRMMDSDSHAHVSKESFIRGLKKIGAPLSDRDMQSVARRLDKRGEGYISYSLLANGVRSHIRNERKEDKRLLILELKKRAERKRILRLGVGEPKSLETMDVHLFSSAAKENFARLFSTSASSMSKTPNSPKRSGFLPKLRGLTPDADSPTSRPITSGRSLNSISLPMAITSRPSSSRKQKEADDKDEYITKKETKSDSHLSARSEDRKHFGV